MALLNRAFGVISEAAGLTALARVELIRLLSESIGSNGIIAGQFCDLRSNWGDRDLAELIEMYGQKTGAPFVASVEAGARVARIPENWVEPIRRLAMNLGLAFQILDDLLDAFATENEAGKSVGQDEGKTTFVSILGPDKREPKNADRSKPPHSLWKPQVEITYPQIRLVKTTPLSPG